MENQNPGQTSGSTTVITPTQGGVPADSMQSTLQQIPVSQPLNETPETTQPLEVTQNTLESSSSNASASGQIAPLVGGDSLDQGGETATTTAQTVVSDNVSAEAPAQLRENKQQKRRISKALTIITGGALVVVLLVAGISAFIAQRNSSNLQSSNEAINEQEVSIGEQTEDKLAVLGLQGDFRKLVINGDLVATGSIYVSSIDNDFFTKLSTGSLSANQTILLPDASGTICLDNNNCNFAPDNNYLVAGDFTETSIDGTTGALALGEGLALQGTTIINTVTNFTETTLNGLDGAVSIQGTTDQVIVSANGNVISLSTPQDIASTSTPTFNSITLTTAGTQNGNTICDISNNCGYAGGTNAFVQNGNSFGETAVLGTNDNFDLSFETNDTVRMTIDGDTGHIGIGTAANDSVVLYANGTLDGDGYGFRNLVSFDAAAPVTNATGLATSLFVSNSPEDYDSVYGMTNNLIVSSPSDINSLVGSSINVSHQGGGAIEDAYGQIIGIDRFGGGSITNAYGLYLEDQTGMATGDNYNIYSEGDGYNWFQGNTAVGSEAPSENATFKVIASHPSFGSNIHSNMLLQATSASSSATGIRNVVNIEGSENYDSIYGSLDEINTTTDVDITNIVGSSALVNHYSAGTINNAYGIDIDINNNGTGSITNAYGLYIHDQTGVATAGNYNIYSAGQGYNLFQGHTGVGANAENALADLGIHEDAVLTVSDTYTGSAMGVGTYSLFKFNGSTGGSAGGVGAVNIATVVSGNTAILGALTGTQSIATFGGDGAAGNVIGLQAAAYNTSDLGVVDRAIGVLVSPSTSAGTTNETYGILVDSQDAGSESYGVRIDSATTQTLWLEGDSDPITSNAGIAFGVSRDTNLYRADVNVLRTDSALSIGTLAATDNASYLCLNSGGIVAGCSGTATGAAFVQGGNSFGTTATLGTNDAQSLAIETGGTTKLTIANSGYITHAPTTSTSTTPSDESAHTITFSDTGAVTTAPDGTADNTRGLNVTVSRSGASGAAITNSYAGTFASIGDLGGTSNAAGIFSYGVGSDSNIGIAGVGFQAGSNTTSSVIGAQGAVETYYGTTGGSVSTAYGLQGSISMAGGNSTYATAAGLNIVSATNGTGGVITNNYGIKVDAQTAGVSDYGIRIDAADTQTVWISGNADNTTASAGIAFGASRDTNLYRSAADTLKTDDNLEVAQHLQVGGNSSFSQCSIITGLSTCTKSFEQVLASTSTTTQTWGANFATGITPSGATNTQSNRGINGLLALYGTQSFSGANRAIYGSATNVTSAGTVTLLGGVYGEASQLGIGSTVTEAVGVGALVSQANGTLTTGYGMRVMTATGTIGTNYGIHVQTQTAGTSDYGLRVDAADTQTLWVSGNADNTTAAAGIAFGSSRDTNLYRSAADTLKTDDNFEVANKVQIGTLGGTFAQCLNAVTLFTCNNTLEQATATTETTVQTYGANLVTGITPAGATNTVENRALNATLALYGAQSFNSSNGNYGISGSGINATTSGTVALLGGVNGGAVQGGAGSTVTEAFGLQGSVAQSVGTLTTGYGLRILSSTGTIANNYGIHVQTQTSGTTDYGLRVDTADTQTLWIAGNDASATTAAKGIAFGSARDVTLYRGAADQLKTDDSLLIAPTSGSTTALNVTASTADYIFTVDSSNGRVGINLGSNNVPTEELHVNGAGLFYGSATAAFVTPVGSTVGAKIAVTPYAVGGADQVIAVGLTSGAQTNSRGISIFDARTSAHQPSLAVFSPDETDIIGFSWDGSNTLASVKVLTGSMNFQTNSVSRALFDTSNNLYLGNADTSGVASSPNNFTLRGTGSSTVGTAGANVSVVAGAGASSSTGSVGGVLALQGGAAGGSGANNGGAVTIDGGAATGAGNRGNIYMQQSGSNVGIGLTAGSNLGGKLTVASGNASTIAARFSGSASQTADLLKFADSAGNTLSTFTPQAAGNQRLQFNIYNTLESTPTNYERLTQYADSSNNLFKIETQNGGSGTLRNLALQGSGGRVGIGTSTTVGYKLDVSEDRASSYSANFLNDGNDQNRYGVRIQAGADDASGTTYYLDAYDGDGDQVGYIANTAGTFALTDVSDVRTKTNINDTEVDALSVLNALQVVDFNRLQNPDGPRITGFIAQQVQDVYGQAVTTGSNGYLGVMKDAFIPVLVRGVQQQQTQISSLNTSNNDLQSQIDDLRAQVNGVNTGSSTAQNNSFATLNVSGVASVGSLEVSGSVSADSISIAGNAVVGGNLRVNGHIIGNKDTRGVVTIPAGELEAEHTFETPYEADSKPVVILTATNVFAPSYRVESTENGFTVYFEEAVTTDVKLNYQVQQ